MSRAARARRALAGAGPRPADRTHPAVLAYGRIAPEASIVAVETIKDDHGSMVCRLRLDPPMPATLIAKRQTTPRIEPERVVYEEVLPRAGIPALRSHGSVPGDGGSSWIFLDDAGPGSEARRVANLAPATGWFAALHLATARMTAPAALPARDTTFYAQRRDRARALLAAARSNPAVSDSASPALADAVEALDRVAMQWPAIEAAAARMPATLVHGDVARKNVVIAKRPDGAHLLPIDWGFAAWGLAAEDLAFLDEEVHLATVAREWGWTRDDESMVVAAGRILRGIVCFEWDAPSVLSPWPTRALRKLDSYRALVARGLDVLSGRR